MLRKEANEEHDRICMLGNSSASCFESRMEMITKALVEKTNWGTTGFQVRLSTEVEEKKVFQKQCWGKGAGGERISF